MNPLTTSQLSQLERVCPGGLVHNVDLAAISQWRIGGHADLVLRPASTEQLANLRAWLNQNGLPSVVIGLTSNLLFADEGIRVPVIQISDRMASIHITGSSVHVQAGAWVPGIARKLMQEGLTGAEHTCGIPGTLGGLICMNGGSQRQGIGSNLTMIESVDPEGRVLQRPQHECHFAYRRSIFQSNGEVITAATLAFEQEEPTVIRSRMRQILMERRHKFPRKLPNCGSVFKSDPAMYAEIGPPGAAIERLGFKGLCQGGAQVSPQHANFIVNTGKAKASDVLTLIAKISNAVESATGYRMEAEACYVTPTGEVIPADQFARTTSRSLANCGTSLTALAK